MQATDMNGRLIQIGDKVNAYPIIGDDRDEPKLKTVRLIRGMHGRPNEPMIWFEEGGGCHHPQACVVVK